MSSKSVLILVFLMLYGSFAFPFAKPVVANPLPSDDFAIRADGQIDPATAPVTTLDNVTYTLTRNVSLFNTIRVERSNILIDGAGYTIVNEQYGSFGLTLNEVNNVTVRNLNFKNSWGFYLAETSDCDLVGNNFTDCYWGFLITLSYNATLVQNTMKNTSFGEIYGDSINHYLHSIDTSNTIDGKPIYYLINQKNLTINASTFPEIGYLALINSTEIAVDGLTLAAHRSSLFFAFTNNSEITGNTVGNNVWGIWLVSSSNNRICKNEIVDSTIPITLDLSSCNNIISENRLEGTSGLGIQVMNRSNVNTMSYNNVSGFQIGILMSDSSSNNVFLGNKITNCCNSGLLLTRCQNNTFIKNTIMNTTTALYLDQVETCNNTFFENNFEDNGMQVEIPGTIGSNVWDNGHEGNYWSDYNGTDSNQDGIGDTPHVIDENNTDHYPLMGTFQSFNMSATSQKPEEMDIVSNSTIEEVGFILYMDDHPYPIGLVLTIQGQNGTTGFCRITLQNDLLNSSVYPVQMPEYSITSRIVWSNGTHTTFYFIYNHTVPDTTVFILPEFPSFLVIPLFMIATLLAMILYKRRHLTRA